MLWLGLTISATAQQLKIGDKVPDINIGKIINYKTENIRFSEIKARLVILDYWSIWCSPCISNMPHMDSLQKKFKDEVFILPATKQEVQIIKPFWAKNKYLNSTSLPTTVGDTLLRKYIPYSGGVPYHVWILDGKLFAMTSGNHANEKDIRDVLDGRISNWALGSQVLKEYDVNHNLHLDTLSSTNVLKFYSAISEAKSEYESTMYNNFDDKERSFTRLLFINYPIRQFYQLASVWSNSHIDKWIIKDVNRNKYFNPDSAWDRQTEWNRDNSYCYEAILPGKLSKKQMADYMLSDLDKFFGLNRKMKIEEQEHWTISLLPGVEKINDHLLSIYLKVHEKKARLEEKLKGVKGPHKEIDDLLSNISDLYLLTTTDQLSKYIGYEAEVYVKNETGYIDPFKITMKFPKDIKMSFEELKAELNKLGFDLKKGGFREVEKVVISENYK